MMEPELQNGYIVLADISGFDAYIADVEIEHAQGVLSELLELIVAHLTPPLRLATLERDAVLTYAPETDVPRGETLLELEEATYVAFQDRLESIRRNNTCNCRACSAVPTLDLKFIAHYGAYTAQLMDGGSVALGGLDANLVHDRLLKDQGNGSNRGRSYALFTEQSLDHMGVHPEGMHTHSGSYPHLGEVKTASVDLRPRYEALTAARHAFVAPEEADLIVTHDFSVPPAILWDWLNDPQKRTRWMSWRTWSAVLRPGGRTGIGASNHCTHGLGTIVETVLDWRPYRYFTVKSEQASFNFSLMQTYQIEPMSSGDETRLRVNMRLQKPKPKWLKNPLLKVGLGPIWRRDYERLAQLLAEDGGL